MKKDKKIFDEIKKAKTYGEYKKKIEKYRKVLSLKESMGLDTLTLKIDENIIYVPRGTNFWSFLNDWKNNKKAYYDKNNIQGESSYLEYQTLTYIYGSYNHFYLLGHSLGGRIVQDVIYSAKKDNITMPVRAATFNVLGYN